MSTEEKHVVNAIAHYIHSAAGGAFGIGLSANQRALYISTWNHPGYPQLVHDKFAGGIPLTIAAVAPQSRMQMSSGLSRQTTTAGSSVVTLFLLLR